MRIRPMITRKGPSIPGMSRADGTLTITSALIIRTAEEPANEKEFSVELAVSTCVGRRELPYLRYGDVVAVGETEHKLLLGTDYGHVECIDKETGQSQWMYIFPTKRATITISSGGTSTVYCHGGGNLPEEEPASTPILRYDTRRRSIALHAAYCIRSRTGQPVPTAPQIFGYQLDLGPCFVGSIGSSDVDSMEKAMRCQNHGPCCASDWRFLKLPVSATSGGFRLRQLCHDVSWYSRVLVWRIEVFCDSREKKTISYLYSLSWW